MTPQDYFNLGAEAMRTEIVAQLLMKGLVTIAPSVLKQELPKFQIPETQNI